MIANLGAPVAPHAVGHRAMNVQPKGFKGQIRQARTDEGRRRRRTDASDGNRVRNASAAWPPSPHFRLCLSLSPAPTRCSAPQRAPRSPFARGGARARFHPPEVRPLRCPLDQRSSPSPDHPPGRPGGRVPSPPCHHSTVQ